MYSVTAPRSKRWYAAITDPAVVNDGSMARVIRGGLTVSGRLSNRKLQLERPDLENRNVNG